MAQRKRRGGFHILLISQVHQIHSADLLAKVFYAWIHVRNLGAVKKNDIDRAITYHDKRLMKRVFNAWYFTQVTKQKCSSICSNLTQNFLVWGKDAYC